MDGESVGYFFVRRNKNKLIWNGLVETDFKYWENKFDKTMNKVGFRLTL
jgi:hypothetical protein